MTGVDNKIRRGQIGTDLQIRSAAFRSDEGELSRAVKGSTVEAGSRDGKQWESTDLRRWEGGVREARMEELKVAGLDEMVIMPKVGYEAWRGVNGFRRTAKVRFVGFTTANDTRRRAENCLDFSTVMTGEGRDGGGKAGSGF